MYIAKYQKDHLWLQYVVIALILSSIGALILFGYLQHVAAPTPKFFKVTQDKQVIQPVALTQPFLASNELLNWFTKTIQESYSFNYHNVRAVIKNVRGYYTKNGHKSYSVILRDYNNLSAILKHQLVLTVMPLDVPKILKEQIINGRYAWKVEIPILLTYQSKGILTTREHTITAFIIRVPAKESSQGVQIAQMISSRNSRVVLAR